jgi:hypothetical protein
MPTPPFSVVHINKAFCTLSGLTHSEVLQKPVETILKVVQDIPSFSGEEQPTDFHPMKSEFILSKPRLSTSSSSSSLDDKNFCKLHVSPITDGSQNTMGMTHVLIKIEPWVEADSDSSSSSNAKAIVSDLDKPTSNIERSQIAESTAAHQVTVG